MGTLLAIDTAAPRLQLALLRDDGRLEMAVEDMATGQAERLFPALAELLARFAATADPALYPPEAAYIRGADAKPQEKFRVARVPETAP